MKILYATFVLIAYFILPPLYAADLPQGYVVGWGDEALYGCDDVSAPRSFAGVVTIKGQLLSNAVSISAGSGHRLALLGDGTVFGWGYNNNGQAIGYDANPIDMTNGPVKIDGEVLSNAIAICAGSGNSLALKSDHTAISFGYDYGASNTLAGLSNIVAVGNKLALRDNGEIVAWRNGKNTMVPTELSNVVAVAAAIVGGLDNLALKNDGTVAEWNADSSSPVASTQSGLSNVVAIASGAYYHLALKKDGTVFGWGRNDSGEATGVATRDDSSGLVTIGGELLTNVVAIAAGGTRVGHSLALKKDGTIVSWGSSFYRLDVPLGLSNVVAIAAGDNYCLAITTNAAVAEKFRQK